MQTITCDVCRKKVEKSITGLTFFYLGEHNICESCKDNLDVQLKTIVRGKEPFSYEWYDKFVLDSVSKAKAKGK